MRCWGILRYSSLANSIVLLFLCECFQYLQDDVDTLYFAQRQSAFYFFMNIGASQELSAFGSQKSFQCLSSPYPANDLRFANCKFVTIFGCKGTKFFSCTTMKCEVFSKFMAVRLLIEAFPSSCFPIQQKEWSCDIGQTLIFFL